VAGRPPLGQTPAMSRWTAALSRHRRVVVIAAVVGAIVVVTLVTVVAGTRDDDLVPATEASTVPPPSGPHGEFLRLFDEGRKASYSVTYRQTGPAGESTVRQARRPPDERVETESGAGAEAKHTLTIVSATGRVGCNRQGDGPWSCEPQPGRGSGAITDILSSTIVAQISALKVEPRDDRVGGQDVRCFVLSGGDGPPAEMCLTREGILARVTAGETRLDLTALNEATPPDSAFVPPAPPAG
jgi:hypothetical protein